MCNQPECKQAPEQNRTVTPLLLSVKLIGFIQDTNKGNKILSGARPLNAMLDTN